MLLFSTCGVAQATVTASAALSLALIVPGVDCNSNGTPDELEADCNTNSTADDCDLNVFASGTTGNLTPVAIPDAGSVVMSLTANQQVFVVDADVRVNIRHSFDADLTMAVSRVGVTVTLATGVGGSGDNFSNTVFDSQAAIAISGTDASPPYTGTFVPMQSLDAFNSMPKAGAWTLTVADNTAGNTGTILSWTLTTRQRTTADCNTDGTPDLCHLAGADCNTNNSLDICEMLVRDCNTNGTLDSCEALADCNTNLTLDICDLLALTGSTPTATIAAAIIDLNVAATSLTPTQNVFVADLNVMVNIRHSADSQLILALSAWNRTVTLAAGIGGNDDNFTGTVFDQQAGTSIDFAAPPFAGTFRPSGDLGVFNGVPKATTWTLSVRDGQFGDTGTLLSWTLIALYQPSTDCDSNGMPDACEMSADDCNTNGSLDRCELIRGDCNTDGTLDRCQSMPDCNANFTPDACELETMASGFRAMSGSLRALSDQQSVTSTISAFLQGNITDVNARLDVLHTAVSDLAVSLASSGVTVTLASGVGGLGADFNGTIFDQQAATPITDGSAPFTGTFRPLQSLNEFNGKSAANTWRLNVFDSVNSNTGTLLAWALDVSSVTDRDCNTNGTLDACEGGCNTNGTPDECEGGCNTNGIPDACELAGQNCNTNGTLDVCELAVPGKAILSAFALGVNLRIPSPGESPDRLTAAINVPQPGQVTDVDVMINIQHTDVGDLTINLKHPGLNRQLVDRLNAAGPSQENFTNTVFDQQASQSITSASPPFTGTFRPQGSLGVSSVDQRGDWTLEVTDTFQLDTGTLLAWGMAITTAVPRDCNTDGQPDECNLQSGGSVDVNTNNVPDVCEDCNTNGTLDVFEPPFTDCDTNLVPDICETDCDTNGIPDICVGPVSDCNTNGTLDLCELLEVNIDCNSNSTLDVCEIDCNTDGTRDGCGHPPGDADCDTNLLPDVCDADCNTNHTPDACDVAIGAADCDANHIPDICDADCNTNGMPDGCESGGDCDSDGIVDICQLRPYIVRLSQTPQGVAADQSCFDPAVSAEGRYVAFYSIATNLAPADTNGFTDVFLFDRVMLKYTNIHHNNAGILADGPAFGTIWITPDGRHVGFVSRAPNLGVMNNLEQVFVYDRQLDQVEMISVKPGGGPGNSFSSAPAISADGRFVAFESFSSDLVGGDTNGRMDVFVRDRLTQQTTRISTSVSGTQSNGDSGGIRLGNFFFVTSRQVVISADNRYIAFASDATNLVPGDINNARDVFIHDRMSGLTSLVSVNSAGEQANGISSGYGVSVAGPHSIDMTSDARFIAFDSEATNLVPGDLNGRPDLFLRDRWTGQTTIIPVGGSGGSLFVLNPFLSNNGRFVTFFCDVQGVVSGQFPSVYNFFRFDRYSNTLSLVSRNVVGAGGNANSGGLDGKCCMTPDGSAVFFSSSATNLTSDVPGPAGKYQMYVAIVDARPDCDANERPDACDADENTNGTPDACECACAGDVNGDLRIDGADVAAWVRCALADPIPTDRCACAAGLTTPQFVAALLQADPDACP